MKKELLALEVEAVTQNSTLVILGLLKGVNNSDLLDLESAFGGEAKLEGDFGCSLLATVFMEPKDISI